MSCVMSNRDDPSTSYARRIEDQEGSTAAIFSSLPDLGQSLSRFVLLGKAPRRVDRRGQRLAGAVFVSNFQRRQAEMVLDDGLIRQSRGALPEQVRCPLVH